MSTVTAWQELPKLVRALAQAKWGILDGRSATAARDALQGLVKLLDDKTATGSYTIDDVADAAGKGRTSARNGLLGLEALGVLTWWRGRSDHEGTPQPSLFRVSKRALVALIIAARGSGEKARRALARRAARIARWQAWLSRKSARVRCAPTGVAQRSPKPPKGGGLPGESPHTHNPLPEDDTMSLCPHQLPPSTCPTCHADDGPRRVQSCGICSRPASACRASQANVAEAHRHEYTPGTWITVR